MAHAHGKTTHPRIGGRNGRDDGSLRRPRARLFFFSLPAYAGTQKQDTCLLAGGGLLTGQAGTRGCQPACVLLSVSSSFVLLVVLPLPDWSLLLLSSPPPAYLEVDGGYRGRGRDIRPVVNVWRLWGDVLSSLGHGVLVLLSLLAVGCVPCKAEPTLFVDLNLRATSRVRDNGCTRPASSAAARPTFLARAI